MDRRMKGKMKKKSSVELAGLGQYVCQKGKRGIAFILLTAAMLMALAGCSNTKLVEGFDEETVENAARGVVNSLVSGEYDKIISEMSQEMQAAISAADLEANMELMNAQTGAFQEIKSISVVGQQDAAGADAAVAVVIAEFENCSVTYAVSYDTSMKIIGLWMK